MPCASRRPRFGAEAHKAMIIFGASIPIFFSFACMEYPDGHRRRIDARRNLPRAPPSSAALRPPKHKVVILTSTSR